MAWTIGLRGSLASRQAFGRLGLMMIVALFATTQPAPASSDVVLDPSSSCGPLHDGIVQDCHAPTVAEYRGWVAWSRSDTLTGEYALVIRYPNGAISLAPVAEGPSPFDVELGPSDRGVVAVYSRCSDTFEWRGCSIYELALGTPGAVEKRLEVPGGGSVHEPAIWGNRMVLLRRNPSGGSEDPPFAGHRPDNLVEWKIGSPRLSTLPLPGSRGTHWPTGLTGLVAGLAFDGTQLAYETVVDVHLKKDGSYEGVITLWRQRLGHGLEPLAQTTSGGGSVCWPRFLSPVLSGGWLYFYYHACNPTGVVGDDRWTRYRLTGHRVQRARHTFIQQVDGPIFSVVPVANGVIWDNGEVHQLKGIIWRSMSYVRPKGFPPLP